MEQQQSPEQAEPVAVEGKVYYEALVPIAVGGVRAYNPGDRVPAGNVEAHGYVVGEDVRVVPVAPEPEAGGALVIGTVPEEVPNPEGSKEPEPAAAEPLPEGEQSAPKRRR